MDEAITRVKLTAELHKCAVSFVRERINVWVSFGEVCFLP